MKVVVDDRVTDPQDAPAATGRTVYRIAQECLTNARKHAPGTEVTLTVAGGPGDGLTIEVANPAPTEPFERVPGSGQGLIGLTERATLMRRRAGARSDEGRRLRGPGPAAVARRVTPGGGKPRPRTGAVTGAGTTPAPRTVAATPAVRGPLTGWLRWPS